MLIGRPVAAQQERVPNNLSAKAGKLPLDFITQSRGLAVSNAEPVESRYTLHV